MSGIESAFEAFKAICDFMRSANLKYEVPKGENIVFTTIKGEEFPATLMFSVDSSRERVDTYGELPFPVEKEYLPDLVRALNSINSVLPMGKFCYDAEDNICSFESSEYLTGLSGFTEEYGAMLVKGAYTMIRDYVSPLFEVASGRMTAEQIVQIVKQKKEKK